MLYGVRLSTAVAAAVVMAAIPAAVAVLSRLFLRERIAPRVAAGIACAVCGIALVAVSKPVAGEPGDVSNPGGIGSLLGVALLLGAVLCEASYVVIGKKLTGSMSAGRISALVNLWGLLLVTPLGVWQALSFDFSAVNMPSWWMLLFYSLAASMVTVWLWMTGLRHVPASSAGIFTVLLPISAAVVGVVFLGERVSVTQAAAFGLAIAGVLLATWPSRSRRN
jgi:drug/metabolite transporter (DMT)-like permease